jgi:hypothetical protein
MRFDNGGSVERWNGGTVERWNGGTPSTIPRSAVQGKGFGRLLLSRVPSQRWANQLGTIWNADSRGSSPIELMI